MKSILWMVLGATALSLGAMRAEGSLLLGGQTIAGGASATSSDAGGDATKVVDGALGNGPTSEWTNVASGAYFTVDLGKQYRISDLNLLNGNNQNDRQTGNYSIYMSTSGAFGGEQQLIASGVAPPKSAGFQDLSIPAFSNPTNNPNLVGRYLRFVAADGVIYGPGVTELKVRGVSDRGTGALAATTSSPNQVDAKAFTRTVNLTDTAPASYTLRLITPTSGSVVQSLNASYTVTGDTYFGDGTSSHVVTNNANDPGGNDVVWNQATIMNDVSQGWVTVDLGQEMIIDGFNLRNSTSSSTDRGTKNYLIRVSDDPTFAEQNNTEVVTGMFSGIGATDSKTLTNPVLGRYVRFISSDYYGFSAGLDDLTVLGRTFTSQVLATGSGQIGDSSTFGTLGLSQALPSRFNLLALDVTGTGGGWSSSTLQTVEVPEPTTCSILLAGAAVIAVRRRRA